MNYKYDGWSGFESGTWVNEINVRSFIRHNYTPYDGDESFLESPTSDTLALWDKVMELSAEEMDARAQVFTSLKTSDMQGARSILCKQYDNVKEVHLEPYHPLGISKLEQLGRAVTYDNRTFLDAHTLTARTEEMTALCGKTVRIS